MIIVILFFWNYEQFIIFSYTCLFVNSIILWYHVIMIIADHGNLEGKNSIRFLTISEFTFIPFSKTS